MEFVQQDGVWLLVDGPNPASRLVLATLRDEIEVIALAEFCKLTLAAPDRIPEHFSVSHKGAGYTVTPLGSPGEKLSLVITGGGTSATIATEFTVPAKEVGG